MTKPGLDQSPIRASEICYSRFDIRISPREAHRETRSTASPIGGTRVHCHACIGLVSAPRPSRDTGRLHRSLLCGAAAVAWAVCLHALWHAGLARGATKLENAFE